MSFVPVLTIPVDQLPMSFHALPVTLCPSHVLVDLLFHLSYLSVDSNLILCPHLILKKLDHLSCPSVLTDCVCVEDVTAICHGGISVL